MKPWLEKIKNKTRRHPNHLVSTKAFLISLVAQGRTWNEIITETGLNPVTVSGYIHAFSHGQHSFVYIENWIRIHDKGPWAAVYRYGIDQPSMTKPLPKTALGKSYRNNPNWVYVKSNSSRGNYYEYREFGHPEAGRTIYRNVNSASSDASQN